MKFKILTTIGMLLLIFGLLLTAFQVAIYGDADYGFYEKEYKTYGVANILDMTDADIMKVTEHMMDYLIGKEDKLSIDVMVDGEYQDFFNEQDRLHLADVKNLFLGGLLLRNVCMITSFFLLLFAALVRKRWDQEGLPMGKEYLWGHLRALLVMALFALVVAIGCMVNFDASFRIFHRIFFTNNLWIFDPRSDYMINMLPEGFFFDFVVRIARLFGAFLIGITGLLGGLVVFESRKRSLQVLVRN